MSYDNERVYNERVYKVVIGTAIALTMWMTASPARGDRLVVTAGNNQNVPVMEGQPGTLTWIIQNQGPGQILLNDNLRTTGVFFNYTGDDMDDKPLLGTINGCNSGVALAGSGGQCVLVVNFTTPAKPDTQPDENNDRGFWDLQASQGSTPFPTLAGTDLTGKLVTSDLLVGHVEVDDPGVKAVTPEPSTMTLTFTSILFGLSAWALKQSGKALG